MNRIIETITISQTVLATFTTQLNAALLTISAENIINVQTSHIGTAAAPRYVATITYYKFN